MRRLLIMCDFSCLFLISINLFIKIIIIILLTLKWLSCLKINDHDVDDNVNIYGKIDKHDHAKWISCILKILILNIKSISKSDYYAIHHIHACNSVRMMMLRCRFLCTRTCPTVGVWLEIKYLISFIIFYTLGFSLLHLCMSLNRRLK